jgi:hypothetical protein
MAANKIVKLSMVSDFNENWYLGLFCSEELIGNDENCIQDHFYEATIFKMTNNKIVKMWMVSDFNENWYLGVFWSEELVGNDEICIHNLRYQFSLKLENIEILPILLAAILKIKMTLNAIFIITNQFHTSK